MRLKDKVAIITGGSRGIGFGGCREISGGGSVCHYYSQLPGHSRRSCIEIERKVSGSRSGWNLAESAPAWNQSAPRLERWRSGSEA